MFEIPGLLFVCGLKNTKFANYLHSFTLISSLVFTISYDLQ